MSVLMTKDENGNWVSVKTIKGENGSSGVHYGTTPPADPNVKIWIDPNGSPNFVAPDKGKDGQVLVSDSSTPSGMGWRDKTPDSEKLGGFSAENYSRLLAEGNVQGWHYKKYANGTAEMDYTGRQESGTWNKEEAFYRASNSHQPPDFPIPLIEILSDTYSTYADIGKGDKRRFIPMVKHESFENIGKTCCRFFGYSNQPYTGEPGDRFYCTAHIVGRWK